MNLKGIVLTSAILILASVVMISFESDDSDAEETYFAEIDGTRYTSLQEAVDASNSGDIIKLISDIDSMSTVRINDYNDLIIDLNGYTIQSAINPADSAKHLYAIDNYGKLILRDSSDSHTGTISARGIENLGDGMMTIESGTYLSIDERNGGAAVWNEATLLIKGGTFRSTFAGSASDKFGAGCLNNSGTATIVGGFFDGISKRTYAIISTGTLLIDPATDDDLIVSGAHGGLAIDAGTAVVNGGKYSSTDYYGLYVSNDGVGTDPMMAAVTVNGGSFTGPNYSVWIGSDYNDPVNSTIEIKGGTFNKPLNAQNNTRDGAIVVKGGVFSDDVSSFVPSGYVCKSIDGKYHVATDVTPSEDNSVSSEEFSIIADFGTSNKATIDMPSASISIAGTAPIGDILVSAIETENHSEAPDAIKSFEITIITIVSYTADITVDAQIPNGHRALAYYIDESGDLIPVEVVNYTSSTVTFRTTHTTPFVIMSEEIPATPSVPDDDEDDYPFIPGQNVPQTSSGSDDGTTLVAAAAAVVVIMLAVVAIMATRNH